MSTATLESPELTALTSRALLARETHRIRNALATKGTAASVHGDKKARPAAGVLLADLTYCDAATEKGRTAIRLFAAVASGQSDAVIAQEARSLVGLLVEYEALTAVCAIENGEPVPARFVAGAAS